MASRYDSIKGQSFPGVRTIGCGCCNFINLKPVFTEASPIPVPSQWGLNADDFDNCNFNPNSLIGATAVIYCANDVVVHSGITITGITTLPNTVLEGIIFLLFEEEPPNPFADPSTFVPPCPPPGPRPEPCERCQGLCMDIIIN